jgi:hypothetical protein
MRLCFGWRARATGLLVLAVLLTSCGGTSSSNKPSNSGLLVNEAARVAIEALMRQRADAMTRRDLSAFQATIDPERPALRRAQVFLFRQVETVGPPTSSFKVLSVEPYLDRYVRALVEEGADEMSRALGTPRETLYVRDYFRRDGDRWLLTEPRSFETGGGRVKTLAQIEIHYDAQDDSVIARMAPELQSMRRSLDALAPAPVADTLILRFYATAESAEAVTVGYTPDSGCRDRRSDVSFYPGAVAFLADGSPWTTSYEFIRSCVAGWLLEQVVPGVRSRLTKDWWLDFGFAELSAGFDRASSLRAGCAGVPVPTLAQMRSGPPAVGTPQFTEDAYSRYHAYARSMADYLYTTFGKSKFWELMQAYRDDTPAEVAFPKVLNVSPEQLYADWIAWAKKKYC